MIAIWALAYAGYTIAQNLKMTAEKARAYVEGLDLNKLSAAERAQALKRLADMLNKLSLEERQRMQADRMQKNLFDQMTEEEKGAFIEATLPTGFKQMLASFEKMPEAQRHKVVEDALKRMREQRAQMESGTGSPRGTNGQPPISPELEAKVRTIGLKSFYSESSAQTKAELAPLLEEMQHTMENGRFNRGR